MAISLFSHNETAYCAAITMLSETGKAAIIHPTGTGKSFIGFKLCEDNPDKRICWLAPSEYIFKTQLENLEKSGAELPSNTAFFTYARLMLMEEPELKDVWSSGTICSIVRHPPSGFDELRYLPSANPVCYV